MLNVLTGKVNPSGKLNETYPIYYEDTPAYAYYPSKERSSEYRESLYVGYRYYTTVGKSTRFPFGYGLSYTKFDYRKLSVDQDAENVRLSFTIKNSGKYNGDEVAQVYVQFPEIGVKVPIKQLKGFERVHIAKGKTLPVTITVPKKELRIWNERKCEFFTPSGNYVFMVGASSDDIRLQQVVKL